MQEQKIKRMSNRLAYWITLIIDSYVSAYFIHYIVGKSFYFEWFTIGLIIWL